MSTIITALLLIISTIGIPVIFFLINRRKNRTRNETFLKVFSQEATRQGLSFSRQELLRSKIIGLDDIKKMLLVFDFANAGDMIGISMEDVKNCTAEKIYDNVVIGSERNEKIEPHLRSIDLKFTFKNNIEPIQVSFYDSSVNGIYEMAELEEKAKTWAALLSKMVFKELKISA
jgi:hypothetical protein